MASPKTETNIFNQSLIKKAFFIIENPLFKEDMKITAWFLKVVEKRFKEDAEYTRKVGFNDKIYFLFCWLRNYITQNNKQIKF